MAPYLAVSDVAEVVDHDHPCVRERPCFRETADPWGSEFGNGAGPDVEHNHHRETTPPGDSSVRARESDAQEGRFVACEHAHEVEVRHSSDGQPDWER